MSIGMQNKYTLSSFQVIFKKTLFLHDGLKCALYLRMCLISHIEPISLPLIQ